MRLVYLIFLASSLFISYSSFAAQVLKVKGKAILVDTAGDDIRMGQTYYLMSNGKKKGIIKVVKLRPGQALAKLLKGKALPNWTLKKRNSPNTATAYEPSSTPRLKNVSRKKSKSRKGYSGKSSKLALGLALGFSQNSSDVDFLNPNGSLSRSDSYTGSSTSFELIADYQLYKKFYLRGSLGMQNFLTEDAENTQCFDANNQSAACTVDLGYMNLDFWLHYHLNSGKHRFWLGAGLGILTSPKYNSTTALNENDLSTTTLMQVGAGANLQISEKIYIPFWAEYGLFPSSDTVKMNTISAYLGLAYRL